MIDLLDLYGLSPPVSQAEIVAATEDAAPLEVRRAWAYPFSSPNPGPFLISTMNSAAFFLISSSSASFILA